MRNHAHQNTPITTSPLSSALFERYPTSASKVVERCANELKNARIERSKGFMRGVELHHREHDCDRELRGHLAERAGGNAKGDVREDAAQAHEVVPRAI